MALNSVGDLKNELEQVNVEYTDLDLQRKLNQANNRLAEEVGRKFVERIRIEFEDETVVESEFAMFESLDKVVNVNGEGNEIVDSSNYSEDLSQAKVDFDQGYVDDNFFEGLVLKFYHVPSSFKDLELFLAVRNILEIETVQTTDQVTNTQTEKYNQKISAKIRKINNKNSTGVQSGDNTNIGSERPRSLSGE